MYERILVFTKELHGIPVELYFTFYYNKITREVVSFSIRFRYEFPFTFSAEDAKKLLTIMKQIEPSSAEQELWAKNNQIVTISAKPTREVKLKLGSHVSIIFSQQEIETICSKALEILQEPFNVK